MLRSCSSLPIVRSTLLLLLVVMLAYQASAQGVAWTRSGSVRYTIPGGFSATGLSTASFPSGYAALARPFSATDSAGAPLQGGWRIGQNLVWSLMLTGDSSTRCNLTATVGLWSGAIIDTAISVNVFPVGSALDLQPLMVGGSTQTASATNTFTNLQRGTVTLQIGSANTWVNLPSGFYLTTIMDLSCSTAGTQGTLSVTLPDATTPGLFSYQAVKPPLMVAPPPSPPLAAPARPTLSLTTLWAAAAALTALWLV